MLDVGRGMYIELTDVVRVADRLQPCQSLFVAPCSHVWHYKCIRPILNDPRTWPQFLCPNCRAVTDLEADVDDPYDYEEQADDDVNDSSDSNGTEKMRFINGGVLPNGITAGAVVAQPAIDVLPHQDADVNASGDHDDLATRVNTASLRSTEQPVPNLDPPASLLSRRNVSSSCKLQRGIKATRPGDRASSSPTAPSSFVIIPEGDNAQLTEPLNTLHAVTPTAGEVPGPEGPMTPRNDAGPFVFDGSAGRASGRRAVADLVEAAIEDEDRGTGVLSS